VSDSLTLVNIVCKRLFVFRVENTAFGFQLGLAAPPFKARVDET